MQLHYKRLTYNECWVLVFLCFYLAFLVFHVCKFSYYKKTNKATTTATPLTKQYFRLELIGLNLTDITWPEISKFLPSFAKFNSAYSSIVFRTMLGRYSLPVIQFSLMLLGWGIWTPSMLNLLCFAFKISFSRSSWLGLIGKSNFCANITFSIKFALRALLPMEHLLEEGTFEDRQLSIFVIFRLWNTLLKSWKSILQPYNTATFTRRRRLPQQVAKFLTPYHPTMHCGKT